jgi:mannose-6-phosphate isomerase-like protein (cupin superfamily)
VTVNQPITTHVSLDGLERARLESGGAYLEFLRVPAMSAGLYTLDAGASDPQRPHTEDEIYIILEGRAQISVGDTDFPANAGDTIFVPAKLPHRFHSIAEALKVIVVFAPAEGSGKP